MKVAKYKKGGNFTVTNKKMSIDPPKGYHWMEERRQILSHER